MLRSVRQSARSAYNGAGLAATPLVTESQPEICIDLLRVAAVHERYRRAASGDPSFRLVKDRDDFQQLVGGPEPASDGLASIDAIGGTYAKSLAKIGVTTFAQLAATDLVQLATATKAPPALVAVWKDLARIDAIDGIGFRYTNVLARCGVRTLRQLAAADPHRLAVLAAGMSTAGAAKQAPDAASVAAWVAAARSTS